MFVHMRHGGVGGNAAVEVQIRVRTLIVRFDTVFSDQHLFVF